MSRADQERVRDKLLMLSETFRPDLEPLFDTADGVYLTTWDFDYHQNLHEEIVYLPPHLRAEHHGAPADITSPSRERSTVIDNAPCHLSQFRVTKATRRDICHLHLSDI